MTLATMSRITEPSAKPPKVTFSAKVPGGTLRMSAEGYCDDMSDAGVAEFFRNQKTVRLSLTMDITGEDAAERIGTFS